ncbi:class I SAM-dependent methyltransferase [Luminiphilus sp.]|nr:class I SAM-dependent methyltransferase [Luminiphilus sp.]
MSSISSRHTQTVLEIGGGFSSFPRLLIESGRISSYLAVDPAFRHLIEHPESSFDVFTFADKLPQDRQFSIIVIRQVLEHIWDLPDFLAKLKSLGNLDAVIYVEVPNFSHTLRYDSWFDICFEHKHYFTQRSLVSILKRCGLHPFRNGFLNDDHDFYVITSSSGQHEVLTKNRSNTSAQFSPAWPQLPDHYFGYGLNSNLESILNFSGGRTPKYIFDDGVAVKQTYFGTERIEVGPFSEGKLLQLRKKYGDLPVIIFAPFSLKSIRAKLPENQVAAVISGSSLLTV